MFESPILSDCLQVPYLDAGTFELKITGLVEKDVRLRYFPTFGCCFRGYYCKGSIIYVMRV